MTQPLPILTDDEVTRCIPADEESSFGSLATNQGHLPLKAMDVQVTLEGLLGQIELAQTFVNTFDVPLEATYIFPLPPGAAVTKFRMDVAGRIIEGVLRERGTARREYDQAITAGHRAAIAEEERPGVFTLRVGNIMPGESARVRLNLSSPLVYDAGEVTFRFPLVVAPRYIPGRPLSGPSVGDGTEVDTDAVPDASRITPPVLLPGYPNPVQLSLHVDVLPGSLTLHDFRSSLHSVFMRREENGRHRFMLQPGERLNRDFILRYQIGEETIQSSLQLVPDRDNDRAGTFALTLLPPLAPSRSLRPRDIIFVLDRSGSMSGWKMVAARRAVAHMVDSLTDQDRFTIYAFDDMLETPPFSGGPALVEASPRHRQRGIDYLRGIEARGGTEMAQPLDLAVRQLTFPGDNKVSGGVPCFRGEDGGDKPHRSHDPRESMPPNRERVLVLITDGQVGNEDQILRMLGGRLKSIRIFTLGIDSAVNEGFLKRLAALGGGSCDVVESEQRLDEVMYKVHRRIGTPALSNIHFELAGVQCESASIVPQRKLDLFAGVPVTIMGRYRGIPEATGKVQATDDAGRPWSQTITGHLSNHHAAGVLWARSHIRALEDQFITTANNAAALERTIIDTSLRFGVLCRFTAFVAVDKTETVNEGGKQHKVVQAVEAPAGWEMLRAENMVEAAPMGLYQTAQPIPQDDEGEIVALESVDFDETVPTGSVVFRKGCKALNTDFDESAFPVRGKFRKSGRSKRRRKKDNQSPKFGEKAKSEGIFSRLFGSVTGKSNKPLPAPMSQESGEDDFHSDWQRLEALSAYRQRAKDILEEMQLAARDSDHNRLHALGVLLVRLDELLEDMKSIGLPAAVLEPLEKLSHELKMWLEGKDTAPQQIDEMWKHVEEELQQFVQSS